MLAVVHRHVAIERDAQTAIIRLHAGRTAGGTGGSRYSSIELCVAKMIPEEFTVCCHIGFLVVERVKYYARDRLRSNEVFATHCCWHRTVTTTP